MALERLNLLAKGGAKRALKKISELEFDRVYVIESVHKTVSKFGPQVTVNLEGDIFCYLPRKVSDSMLENGEINFIEFKEQLNSVTVGLKRLPNLGRYHPVEFLIIEPEYHV